MKISKYIIFVIFAFFISLFLHFFDFSFFFLTFPEMKKDLTEKMQRTGIEILNSTPLSNKERDYLYFSLDYKEIIEETNKQRFLHNIPILRENNLLNISALNKNEDICKNQYFDHISPDGKGPADLIKEAGYNFVIVAENLAMGTFLSEEDLVLSWMKSPGHRENILNKNYSEIGISAIRCNYEDRNIWISTQHFGTPVSICPSVDEELKKEIEKKEIEMDLLYFKIENLRKDISSFKIKRNSEYEEKIKTYGELVGEYNALVKETEILIEKYNQEVSLFNDCADSYSL